MASPCPHRGVLILSDDDVKNRQNNLHAMFWDKQEEEKMEEQKNILKVLAMTKRPRTCQTDLSGEVPPAAVEAAMAVSLVDHQCPRPALALATALRAVPQTVPPKMEGSQDDVRVKEDYAPFLVALLASLDERIAALTRVLEASDDDPVEMAAARAALARSKSHPQLEEGRPLEELSTRETYRSVLGGGVLPSEEACVLALYRDLLSGDESGEAECNTFTGEDAVNKEALHIELVAQITLKRSLVNKIVTREEVFEHKFAFHEAENKLMLWPDTDAARTVQKMTVENVCMKENSSLAERPVEADDQDQLMDQLPKSDRIALHYHRQMVDDLMRSYTSPQATKAEKLISLLQIIRQRVHVNEIIKRNADSEERLSQLRPIIQGITNMETPLMKQMVTVFSPDDSTKNTQLQATGEEPRESCTSVTEMEGIRRAMDPPLSLSEMASALCRVLGWREQLLSESHSRHWAHDYKQEFKDILHDFEFDSACEFGLDPSCIQCCANEKEHLSSCGKENDEAKGGKLVMQDMLVSGSVSEGTEVHIIKGDLGSTVQAFEWVSEDGFAMPHWIQKRREMAARERESSDDSLKNASDIDFMLVFGPVKWEKRPAREDSVQDTEQGISCIPQPDSDTEKCGSETLHNSLSIQANSSRDHREDDSTCSESRDDILILHAEAVPGMPSFVKVHQVLRREGNTSVRRELTFWHLRSHIATAFSGHVEDIDTRELKPNIEVTLNGDSIDLVPCLEYPERIGDEFVNRERQSGQPSKGLVEKLSEMPIHLVGTHFSRLGIFRKSFSSLELEVIRSMTKPQRICLVLLKHCAVVTKDAEGNFSRKSLCSYELKTAMMWVCERRAPERWTWDGMLESMMAVLDFLVECAVQGALPCYFAPEINLWSGSNFLDVALAVLRLQVLLPRAIQLLLAGLLSSSQAPLMRHLLNLPLDAQQMLWCCWKRRVDDPYPTRWNSSRKIKLRDSLCCKLYSAAVEGRLWSEQFLDTFRWESLPAHCREPDWFDEHGWDTDSELVEMETENTRTERKKRKTEGGEEVEKVEKRKEVEEVEEDRVALSKMRRMQNMLRRVLRCLGECGQCTNEHVADSTSQVGQATSVSNMDGQTNLNLVSMGGQTVSDFSVWCLTNN